VTYAGVLTGPNGRRYSTGRPWGLVLKRNTSGIRHDYKDISLVSPRRNRLTLFALGLSLPLVGTAMLLLGTPRHPAPVRPLQTVIEPVDSVAVSAASEGLAAFDVAAPLEVEIPPILVPPEPQGIVLDLLVKRGDTLELLFRRNGLSLTDLAAMVALPDARTRSSC